MAWDIEAVKKELCGPAALVMAPFHDDLSLNLDALRSNIRYIMSEGLKTGQGFLICPCGVGEYVTLNADEHRQMVETALEVTDGKLPVVVGVAHTDIREVIARANGANSVGAKYVMIAPPFYYEMNQEGICEWFRLLNDSVDVGIMIYDQAWRAGMGTGIEIDTFDRLAELENVVSVKYTGLWHRFQDMIVAHDCWSDRFAFIDSSLGYTTGIAFIHGATGFISGPASWWPEFELKFYALLKKGQYAEADRWHARLGRYMQRAHGEFYEADAYSFAAALVKASMEYVGLTGGPCRPPFRAFDAEEKKALWALLDEMVVKKTE